MTDPAVILAHLDELREATVAAAGEVVARDKDGSFLERTLRDPLAGRLPRSRTEVRMQLARWGGRLGGVDVVFVPDDGQRLGVETKVWDVADSLFDVFKLVVAVQQGALRGGYIVAAGRARDWSAPSAVAEMAHATVDEPVEHTTSTLLETHRRGWERIWSRASARPQSLPAQLITVTAAPTPMPAVPDHEIRIIGVTTTSPAVIALDGNGWPSGAEDLGIAP